MKKNCTVLLMFIAIISISFGFSQNVFAQYTIPGWYFEWQGGLTGPHTTQLECTQNGQYIQSLCVYYDQFPDSDNGPVTAITSPVLNSTVISGAQVTLTATATDISTGVKVKLFADTTQLGAEFSQGPYTRQWTATTPGVHVLKAVARDIFGNTTIKTRNITVISSDTTPPEVILVSPTPADGSILPLNQEVVLQVSAIDNIANVKIYVNGSQVGTTDISGPIYDAHWTPTVIGNYAITAKATDLAGQTTTTPARNFIVGTGGGNGNNGGVVVTGQDGLSLSNVSHTVSGTTVTIHGTFSPGSHADLSNGIGVNITQTANPSITDENINILAPGGVFSVPFTEILNGTYTYIIRPMLNSSNIFTHPSFTFTVSGGQIVPPTTLGDVIISNVIITVSGSTATVTGDVTPTNTTTLTLTLFPDNTYTTPVGGTHPISVTNGSFSVPLTGLSDGTYFFTITDTSQSGTNGNTSGVTINQSGLILANISHSVSGQGDVSIGGKFNQPTHTALATGVTISLLDPNNNTVLHEQTQNPIDPMSGTFSGIGFTGVPNGTYKYKITPNSNTALIFTHNSMIFTVGNGITSSNNSYTFTIAGQGTNPGGDDDDQNGNSFSLNNLFSGLGVNIPSNCVNRQAEETANQGGEQWYCFLAPLLSSEPEINTSASSNDSTPIIPKVVNMFFKVGIAILIVLSVLMFAYNAFQYMLSPGVFDKKAATTGMWNAILGLVIGLSIYLILSIINTNLLNLDIEIAQNTINIEHQDAIANELLTADQFTALTGQAPKTPAEINTIITSAVATKFSTATEADRAKHVCAIKSIIQKENPTFNSGAIGHDEDVGLPGGPGTKSTRAFIASTKKYSSDTAFTTTPPKNDDHGHSDNPVEDTPGLGLDWRFTHGIGLMQVTFIPPVWNNSDYETNPPPWSSRNTLPPSINGLSPKQMFNETNNISNGVDIYKGFLTSNNCGGNSNSANIWLKTFSGYNGGWDACDEQTGTPYGQSVYATFQACVAAL